MINDEQELSAVMNNGQKIEMEMVWARIILLILFDEIQVVVDNPQC